MASLTGKDSLNKSRDILSEIDRLLISQGTDMVKIESNLIIATFFISTLIKTLMGILPDLKLKLLRNALRVLANNEDWFSVAMVRMNLPTVKSARRILTGLHLK